MRSITEMMRPYDAALLVLAVVLVVLYVLTAGQGFPLDDSWIHQVYGRNLAERGEWAFVPGEPSAASTSPLYTVLLAAGYALGVPYLVWTHGLGALALAAAGITGARMAERLLTDKRYAGLLTGAAVIGAWHLVWAAVAGMETMLFSAFTLLLMALAWRELDEHGTSPLRRGAIFGAAAALAMLARPEGLLLAGLCGLAVLAVYLPGRARDLLLWVAGAAVCFAVVIAPYLALNLHLTGGLLPNTAAAKYAQFAPVLAQVSYPERVLNMIYPLVAGGQVLLLPGMIFYAVQIFGRNRGEAGRIIAYALPLLWAVGLILLYAARLPAPYQHGRYVIPALPGLIVAGVAGMVWLVEAGRRSAAGRVLTRTLGLAAGAVFIYFGAGIGPAVYQTDVAIIEEEMVAAAHYIATHISPNDLLAIHDIGAVGYFAPRPLLDIAGLVNPEVIDILQDKEALYDVMQAQRARYLLAFPDQVPGGDVNDERLCPVFVTNGEAAPRAGGANMTLYALVWDGVCDD